MSRRRTARRLGVVAAVAALVAAVLLTRGGTAATEADLVAAPEPTPVTSAPRTESTLLLTATGLADAPLGQLVQGVNSSGWVPASVGGRSDAGCELMYRTAPSGASDVQVLGWRLDDRIVAIMVVGFPAVPSNTAQTALGPAMGEQLESAALLRGAQISTERLTGTTEDTIRTVTVPHGATETVFSNLEGSDGIRYIEVRQVVGERCRLSDTPLDPAQVSAGAPVLGPAGWGDIRYGRPVSELVDLGLLERPERSDVGGGSCALYYPASSWTTDQPQLGLGPVYARDGLVVGITLFSGSTAEGLVLGNPVEGVLAAYPELGSGADTAVDVQGLQELADGRFIELYTGPGALVPQSVDAWVSTNQELVRQIAMYSEPCA